ncbi:biotin transporter BioY [Halobium salinum]|uniref:Biotin transporter BioY n=1 Tax=Halobium salinum TaxID=1364940 RepID=A0ABD5P7Z6_9EURY|nr:biotin transporter BioY [Halobium salinum]
MATSTDSVELVGDEVTRNLARAALFAALMGAFAYVSFPNPLSPGIPVTLQVLGVFLAGIFLGPIWGGFAMVLYLLAGALGLPVFSGGSAGFGALVSQTGGYLVSYPFAAAVVGLGVHGVGDLADPRLVSVGRLVAAMVAGTVVIYTLGILGFWYVGDVGIVTAVVGAAVAFVPVEALKIAAAVGIVRSEAVAAR